MSVGWAVIDAAETVDAALERADTRMYDAKAAHALRLPDPAGVGSAGRR